MSLFNCGVYLELCDARLVDGYPPPPREFEPDPNCVDARLARALEVASIGLAST